MKRLVLAMLSVVGYLCLSSLVHAGTIGVGLRWSTTEETATEGQIKCIEYGLYNPFDVTVDGYLDVSGALVNLTSYKNEYWELEKVNEKLRELQNENVRLTSELKELRRDPAKNLESIGKIENQVGEVDTEKTRLTSERSRLEERIRELKNAEPVKVPAETSSEKAIPQLLCLDIPKLERYDCKIDNKYLGKHLCSGCKSKLFYGEVSAKHTTPKKERAGTGSGVGSSFAVPLTVVVRCSEPKLPVTAVMVILTIVVAIIVAGAYKSKKVGGRGDAGKKGDLGKRGDVGERWYAGKT